MTNRFTYDVFLSYSREDKEIVYRVAEILRANGLRVWFDEWEIQQGESPWSKEEEGLEQSRILLLFMSENAFGAEWTKLEAKTLRFRDPLNNERSFIPVRLDQARIRESIAEFDYISWLPHQREQSWNKLLDACRTDEKEPGDPSDSNLQHDPKTDIRVQYGASIDAYSVSFDGKLVLVGTNETFTLYGAATGLRLREFRGHRKTIDSVAFSPDSSLVLSGANDTSVRLWNTQTGECLKILEGHAGSIYSLAWSNDSGFALSGSWDHTVRLWDLNNGTCSRVFEGHRDNVWSVSWTPDEEKLLSASGDKTVRLWERETGRCLLVLEGHTGRVYSVAVGMDRLRALTAGEDKTVRLWDLQTGRCLRVLEGHTGNVLTVAWNSNHRLALSGSSDRTVRLWDVEKGRCLGIMTAPTSSVYKVAWLRDPRFAISGEQSGQLKLWDLSKFLVSTQTPSLPDSTLPSIPKQVQYTNAKVLLVGESGVGKTGLSKRIALDEWQPSDSTVGAWATHWKLPVSSGDGIEREIWLWDFGGQADQRLIHQLYMDETALAVLVFDGQKEDVFETLGQWDRDLGRASRQTFSKLLVAARVDAGGLRVSRNQVEAFRKERGYLQLLETSAKANLGCIELKEAILNGIRWENIPWRSSPLLFKRLKEEIILMKDAGRVLMRFNELRDALQLRLLGPTQGIGRFTDSELHAVVSLLAGPGVVWELEFGSWILLQPERINAYAQAVIQTLRTDEQERGCLPEERVLNGDLTYQSSMARLETNEERFILLAMHQVLVERGLCFRERTDTGNLLIFPSYYRRERPELTGHPAVLVSYRFSGFLDDIYATLVVRLHHTKPFEQDQLWRYAADFRTLVGKKLGLKMVRRAEGAGELEVYFDPIIPLEEKIIFSKYVHEHLLQNAVDVVRLRHYVCGSCGTPVGNREVAMERLEEWLQKPKRSGSYVPQFQIPTIICAKCEGRVNLWDDLEQHFASSETKQRVRELQEQSAIVLDNESKERALVGEVISTVALAGQLCRELTVSDHGIDMEIEFKSDEGEATGCKLYLQLKSGDSYLRDRRSDAAEVFTIKDKRHIRYWMAQRFPVMLVIRNSDGTTRWMEIRNWLKRATENGRKPVKHIVFDGERLDVMSVRHWRERVLR